MRHSIAIVLAKFVRHCFKNMLPSVWRCLVVRGFNVYDYYLNESLSPGQAMRLVLDRDLIDRDLSLCAFMPILSTAMHLNWRCERCRASMNFADWIHQARNRNVKQIGHDQMNLCDSCLCRCYDHIWCSVISFNENWTRMFALDKGLFGTLWLHCYTHNYLTQYILRSIKCALYITKLTFVLFLICFQVKLDRVLGLTVSCNVSLDCDPYTGTVVYPSG